MRKESPEETPRVLKPVTVKGATTNKKWGDLITVPVMVRLVEGDKSVIQFKAFCYIRYIYKFLSCTNVAYKHYDMPTFCTLFKKN